MRTYYWLQNIVSTNVSKADTIRVANRPGMTPTVPCPGVIRICSVIVCYCQL